MPIQLNQQASAALGEIVRQNKGQLPSAVEERLAAIENQATQNAGQAGQVAQTPLTLQDVEKILQQAMPNQSTQIKQACEIGSGYHPDGKNAKFLTQILSAKVQKIDEVLFRQPTTPAAPRRYDPYFAELTVDPKAQNVLLFNATNVDRNGNALLMKVVMRMTPKLDAIVLNGEAELEKLAKDIAPKFMRHNGNITESSVRQWLGLPHDGNTDTNTINWMNQVAQNAAWMQQNVPGGLEARTRIGELTKELNEVKQRYIDEQLPKLDLTRYRREPPEAKPDVTLIGSSASFIKTADFNEHEFAFGDALKQTSLGANNKELSSSVFIRPEGEQWNRAWSDPANHNGRQIAQDNRETRETALDTAARGGHVRTYDDRIRVSVKAKEGQTLTPGSWLDEAGGLQKLDVNLHLDRGLIFEPGSNARVNILGKNFDTGVPKDDAQLLGNAASSHAVDTAGQNQTVRQFLQSQVRRDSWAQPNQSDNTQQNFTVAQMVYANAASINVGARTLKPIGDTVLTQLELAANKIKLDAIPIEDPQNDGVKVRLTLDEGFLGAEAGKASVKGYTIQVGYFDENNQWIEAKSRTVGADTKSKKEEFTFEVPDFDALQKPNPQAGAAKHLEIRLYNADGIPAERIQVPFREVVWGQP
jgi:hypothetical protein